MNLTLVSKVREKPTKTDAREAQMRFSTINLTLDHAFWTP